MALSRMTSIWVCIVFYVLAILCISTNAQESLCQSFNVTRCTAETKVSDVLFLVDSSQTMQREFFYAQMLDFVEQLKCSLNGSLANRAGMILFSNRIRVPIPLGEYSDQEWHDKINTVREDPTACCTCCTPLAEAFDAAQDEFAERGASPTKIVIVITDGDPYQNDASTIQDPVYNKYLWNPTTFDEARYAYQTVPRSANRLKAEGVKIILLGVPNRMLKRTNFMYFRGQPDPDKNPALWKIPNPNGNIQCLYRNTRFNPKCGKIFKTGSAAFPISNYVLESRSFDPTILLELTTPEFCRPADTLSPTTSSPSMVPSTTPTRFPTSRAPSRAPSRSPSVSPSRSPSTSFPTVSPSRSPITSSPSKAPTTSRPSFQPSRSPTSEAPTRSPSTSAPTRSPTTSKPSTTPTRSPIGSGPTVSPTTSRPTRSPSRAPTTSKPSATPSRAPTTSFPSNSPTFSAPTRSPSLTPSTSIPTLSPSIAPTPFHLDGLDMYVILDRSKSLTFPNEAAVCRRAAGGVQSDADALACWRLFVGFTRALATNLTQIKNMGWKADRNRIFEGIRMNVIAFWCRNEQTDPESLVIGENLDSQAEFDKAMDFAMKQRPNHGTCPGESIEKVVWSIQNNELLSRPNKAAVLLSDGVMYDMPVPKLAAKGLQHFGVSTFAMGIAMPQNQFNTYGLSPKEVIRQRNQLRHFVGGNDSRVFNFGEEGFNLLPVVAGQIAQAIERDIFGSDQKTWWCGYTNKKLCIGDNGVGNGRYCKWMNGDGKWPGGNAYACKDKGFCDWDKALCAEDSTYCYWDGARCQTKEQYLPFRS